MKTIVRLHFSFRGFNKLWLTVIPLLLFSNTLKAQSDTTKRLEEVRVSASRIPVVGTITPSQQITSADFLKNSSYNVADAIRNFSGVNIKDYGGIGGLKTVSVRSLGANHTGVQLDGVQLNDVQNGQVDLGKINLDNVQDITLYNGQPGDIALPARSFASASTLIINSIVPRLHQNKPYKITAGFKTGSFGLVNPILRYEQRINDSWSFNFTNSLQKAHGRYKYKVEGDGSDTLAIRNNADIETVQSDMSVFWRPNDSTRFNLRTNFNNSDRELPGAVVFYNPYTNQSLRSRDLFLQSGFDKKWERFHVLLSGKYSGSYLRYLDPDYLNIAGVLDQRYTQRELYGSGVVAYKLSKNLELAYASDFAFNKLNTNLYNYAYPERFTYLNALSLNAKTGRFEIQGTLLNTFIHEDVRSGDASADRSVWSPSLLATYQPTRSAGLLLRAFYKDIFRNPTFNDLYYTRIGNRSLKPEYATQYNLGITLTKTGKTFDYLTFTTDVYYNKIKDKILAIPNKDLFSWTMLNLGRVDIYGSDLGIKTQLPLTQLIGVSFSGNYTFQKSVDVTDATSSVYGNQIPYTPEHTFSLNAGFNGKNWAVFYNQIYSSGRYYLSENLPQYFVPGFMVSDLSVSHQLQNLKHPISASIELNNLFNQSYAFIRSFPMPGRSVRLSFQITI